MTNINCSCGEGEFGSCGDGGGDSGGEGGGGDGGGPPGTTLYMLALL
jgi:hypothetical protein